MYTCNDKPKLEILRIWLILYLRPGVIIKIWVDQNTDHTKKNVISCSLSHGKHINPLYMLVIFCAILAAKQYILKLSDNQENT